MIKIALVAVSGVLFAVMLKQSKSDFAIYISLALMVIITVCCMGRMETLINYVNKLQSLVTIKSEYLSVLLKMAGIAYVAEITSGICKDCGYASVAGQVELFGKLSVITIGMPIVMALIDTIERCLTI